MNKKTLFISASLIILLAFIGAATIFKANNSHQSAKVESLDIVERIGAPIKGPLEAKVTIVEFFDPACETCSAFYPLVNNLIKRYPGKIKVMMRYTPFHKGSDQVVKLLEAAHLQEQFWPAVEILFAKQQAWTRHHVAQPQSAHALLKDLPLDSAQFMRDVSSENVSKVIMQDIKDGKTLEVRATPQFFVNGKPLVNFGYEQLTQLVEEAIAEAY
ncbi:MULTISPECIES: DsbA family protein [unclassified Colwellia]|uniref:DsbA family protein n=1 Tax=unclassified Colwellia TaxID=196834 RepID=UPI0015F59A6A|nr:MULTISPECIES: thioredoxin domain-containing protein [unclassified Colwellia]MBA6258066.1 thioredoxin domain-containing protein [Colwellia sp. MB3u-28]MBA6259760.1 thioredoxin domain-containing protein [Colwellia sp. MB3u-41]